MALQRRRVLVTGGTGTIGSEIVRILCASGHSVIANFFHDNAKAEQVQRETGCELKRADVGDEGEVSALFSGLPLCAVVHAAGITRDELLLRQSRESWDMVMRTNCDSAFLVMRAALEKLEDGGRLVLIASRVGERGRSGQSAYAASKAAVLGLMKTAAREAASRGITVNAVAPGYVQSAMNEGLKPTHLEAARQESLFQEFGNPCEVASLVRWLLSAEASQISGQIFHCDSRL